MKNSIHYHRRVTQAMAQKKALVALESTVITHGLPYPENLETALAMEEAICESGAAPATIAILQGTIVVGLSSKQLAYLSSLPTDRVRKCSRRDLALAVARGEDGGTTVAGTMIIAKKAGIELFATGGIGGVHRGQPLDVSADLAELARTPVTVVCSGPKSILDLALTREVLETYGIPIVGYQTDEMPAFYSRHSGYGVDTRLDTYAEVAELIMTNKTLGLGSGIVVTVAPPETEALDSSDADEAAKQATREAEEAGIIGPASTPWLLERVNELTDGASMRANVSLLINNARVAGYIAAALADLDD